MSKADVGPAESPASPWKALRAAAAHERPGIEREQYPVTKRFMFVGLSI